MQSHKDATTFKKKSFFLLCKIMHGLRQRPAIAKNAQDAIDVVVQLDQEGGDDVYLDEDAFDNSSMMGIEEAQSMSYSEVGKCHKA